MKVYFLRHAAALDGADDAQRPLSPAGRSQVHQLALRLRQAGITFDLAYTSPLVRARQTLAIVLASTMGARSLPARETPALLNETDVDAFADWLAGLPDAGHLLLVGHEPTLSAHVRRLLGLKRAEALELAKGAIACVRTADRRTGALKFLLTPELLGLGERQPR
jgi:phosphohistidine phosphatase